MHQMSVNGKFDDITRDDLLAVAMANNIKNAAEVIEQVVDVVSDWPCMARDCGVPRDMVSNIERNMRLLN